jgi:glucose-6-phosphate 1-dehydrogenase
VVNRTGQAGLSAEAGKDAGWSRIVVEKPFGSDLKTSLALDSVLQKNFSEHQIYRIDHYLAKETVQNILVFRFANSIFEPIWNRQYIDHVDICVAETLGVEHRAGYYEKAGVLRDMFQNHMMQLLALIAMEPPANFLPEMVRDEKAKLFKSLRPFDAGSIEDRVVLGQYAAGTVDGTRVPAYRDEPGVDSRSLTPTFARMKVFVDNWRWQGVPFNMMSGKRLAEKSTRISVQFKDVPHSIFRSIISDSISANRLTFVIQPEEKISLTFQAKSPGATVCLRPMNMEFSYGADMERILEAYEKVLIDCMLGDQMLFLRQDSEELCWSFFTPFIEDCEKCVDKARILHFYEAGTWGPEALNEIKKP